MPVLWPSEKNRLHGIVADRVEGGDLDIALAGLQRFLAGAMAAHFGGGLNRRAGYSEGNW